MHNHYGNYVYTSQYQDPSLDNKGAPPSYDEAMKPSSDAARPSAPPETQRLIYVQPTLNPYQFPTFGLDNSSIGLLYSPA